MQVEKIALHGGRKHGTVLAIPVGDHDDLSVEVEVIDPKTKRRGMRTGHYTRVRTVAKIPTSDFEWSGFTGPFVPSELDAPS